MNEKTHERNTTDEVAIYWRQIVGTLGQRGLVKQRPRQGGAILPVADAFLLPDRCIFALDMQRLGGIPREEWLKPALWHQWRAALQGRRVFVSDGGGLAITVARRPGQRQRKRLPATIPLDLDEVTGTPYQVILGYTRHGPVTLDLAERNRAILTGGTSGSGKTNLMQSIVLQLAAKHTAAEMKIAIVDTKQVDFGPVFEALPNLFDPAPGAGPIAHTLEQAQRLIEAVEGERLRRQALMARAGVADWREMPESERLPLILLVVDEAADFARTPAMETLVEIARKGRAMGISIILGTQSPSSKVIDPQIRANLPTAIAFQTRTDIESRVILGRKGAEDLNRPGLALSFVDGQWQTVQTLRVEPETAQVLVGQLAVPQLPALDGVEADLVRYAVKRLDGAFIINQLYEVFKGEISRRQLVQLARRWENRGWLTEPQRNADGHKLGRQVSPELVALAQAGNGGHVVTLIPSRDKAILDGHMGGTEAELPPFLVGRHQGDQDQCGRADGHPPLGLS